MGRKRLTGKENFAARTDTGLAGKNRLDPDGLAATLL
jgi:hypothetical protein